MSMDNSSDNSIVLNHILGEIRIFVISSIIIKTLTLVLYLSVCVVAILNLEKMYSVCASIVLFVFWLFDAYYEQRSRLADSLFNKCANAFYDGNMWKFDLNSEKETLNNGRNTFIRCFFSPIVAIFYLAVIVNILIVTFA